MSASFSRRSPYRFFFLWWAMLCLVGVVILWLCFSLPWWLMGGMALQVATALLFLYDKIVAGSRWVRVPEKVLLITSLPGPVGAYLSMQLMRHKTRKESFVWWWKALLLLEAILLIGLVFFYWRAVGSPELPSFFDVGWW